MERPIHDAGKEVLSALEDVPTWELEVILEDAWRDRQQDPKVAESFMRLYHAVRLYHAETEFKETP